jgi:beta-mannosidase
MKSVQYVHAGWQLLGTAAGADAPLPDQNNCDEHSSGQSDSADKWKNAIVPGTVAQSLSTKIGAVENFDAKDWWYRCKFTASPASKGAEQRLRFEGLATLCDVWLNGELILSTRNMFVPHQCKVDHLLKSENELLLRFRSLDAELAVRKPRPRWRTGLVTQQNLRWVRTTLLGRIPGWTPPISPVGPWKNISLETIEQFDLENLDLQTEVRGSSKNPTKHVKTSARLKSISGKTIQSASLHVGSKNGTGFHNHFRRQRNQERGSLVASHPRKTESARL